MYRYRALFVWSFALVFFIVRNIVSLCFIVMFWKFSLDNLIFSQIEILYDYNIESFKQTIPIGDIELGFIGSQAIYYCFTIGLNIDLKNWL